MYVGDNPSAEVHSSLYVTETDVMAFDPSFFVASSLRSFSGPSLVRFDFLTAI